MNTEEFRKYGKEMVDFIAEYKDKVQKIQVTADVEPGYLAPLLPKSAPQKGEPWEQIMKDVESKIMKGITHWNHPHFHAYYPSGNSYPNVLADMLSTAMSVIGFSWIASPAVTELELLMMDWLVRALNLPEHFLVSSGKGGGCLQNSASDSVLTILLSARKKAIKYLKEKEGTPEMEDCMFLPKLVAYTSMEAHSSVDKGAMLAFVKIRILEPDENNSLRGETLKKAIDEDIANGLLPFFVIATLGTTSTAAFDNLDELGKITETLPCCWLHVDAAYGGCSFMCPELRSKMKGIERADSFNANPGKGMLVAVDGSCLWFKDRAAIVEAMTVNPLYLQHEHEDKVVDLRNWGISLTRRFRSLKLWFVMRSYGIEGLQAYVRKNVKLAKELEKMIRADPRFEVTNNVELGLVCFRLVEPPGQSLTPETVDKMNKLLLASIHREGKVQLTGTISRKLFMIRLCVGYEHVTLENLDVTWKVIQEHGKKVLDSLENGMVTLVVPHARRFSNVRRVSRAAFDELQENPRLGDQSGYLFEPDDVCGLTSVKESTGEVSSESDTDTETRKEQQTNSKKTHLYFATVPEITLPTEPQSQSNEVPEVMQPAVTNTPSTVNQDSNNLGSSSSLIGSFWEQLRGGMNKEETPNKLEPIVLHDRTIFDNKGAMEALRTGAKNEETRTTSLENLWERLRGEVKTEEQPKEQAPPKELLDVEPADQQDQTHFNRKIEQEVASMPGTKNEEPKKSSLSNIWERLRGEVKTEEQPKEQAPPKELLDVEPVDQQDQTHFNSKIEQEVASMPGTKNEEPKKSSLSNIWERLRGEVKTEEQPKEQAPPKELLDVEPVDQQDQTHFNSKIEQEVVSMPGTKNEEPRKSSLSNIWERLRGEVKQDFNTQEMEPKPVNLVEAKESQTFFSDKTEHDKVFRFGQKEAENFEPESVDIGVEPIQTRGMQQTFVSEQDFSIDADVMEPDADLSADLTEFAKSDEDSQMGSKQQSEEEGFFDKKLDLLTVILKGVDHPTDKAVKSTEGEPVVEAEAAVFNDSSTASPQSNATMKDVTPAKSKPSVLLDTSEPPLVHRPSLTQRVSEQFGKLFGSQPPANDALTPDLPKDEHDKEAVELVPAQEYTKPKSISEIITDLPIINKLFGKSEEAAPNPTGADTDEDHIEEVRVMIEKQEDRVNETQLLGKGTILSQNKQEQVPVYLVGNVFGKTEDDKMEVAPAKTQNLPTSGLAPSPNLTSALPIITPPRVRPLPSSQSSVTNDLTNQQPEKIANSQEQQTAVTVARKSLESSNAEFGRVIPLPKKPTTSSNASQEVKVKATQSKERNVGKVKPVTNTSAIKLKKVPTPVPSLQKPTAAIPASVSTRRSTDKKSSKTDVQRSASRDKKK